MMERERGAGGLDPMREPARWERVVATIITAAEPELERRRRNADLPELVLQWARPALAAAATVALLVSAVSVLGRGPGTAAGVEAPLAGAVVPESYAAWLTAGYEPTVTELVVALEEARR